VIASTKKRLAAPARQDSILSAAISEFAHAGYDRTRVADIASKVAVTEPVVFQNFGTKAHLFARVLERATDELLGYLQVIHEHTHGVDELVAAILDHEYQDRLHSHGGLGLIFADASERSEPSIRQAARRAHRRTTEAVAVLLRRGQREGTIRKDIDAATLAGLVLSQIHARQFRRLHGETSATLERDVRAAVLAALRPQHD
jgi:AcrR family transcriptional regulator